MGTTNILDLNNRLTKVEKENVAQNSYTSLKNKPKINGVTLTGNKSLADIGAAPIKIDGHTPANQGFAGFNTSGLDLTNRYPVAFYIVSNTENVPHEITQGVEGISVSFDPTTHYPNLYILGTASAEWKDTDCFVIYA